MNDDEILIEAFSEAQDQLLAISALAKGSQHNFDLAQLGAFFTQKTQEILNARAVFLGLDGETQLGISLPEDAFQIEDFLPLSGPEFFQILDADTPLYALIRPLGDEGQLILGFSVDTPQESFSPVRKLAAAIMGQAEVQISNILLHKKLLVQAKLQSEMEAARQVQANLLPKENLELDDLELDAAVHFKPAQRTGGDFYDYARTPTGFGFTVGDIAGKGMPAALLMSITLNSIRNKGAFLAHATPAKILGRVNQDVYSDFTQTGAFATVFTGCYIPAEEKIIYANAGHSPVIFCPAEGPARLLEADGPALGVLPESLSENQSIAIQSGDLIVIGTDGFSESENKNGGFFGYDRLLREVESLRQHSAREICDALVAAIRIFAADNPQSDDQTLLVLKRL